MMSFYRAFLSGNCKNISQSFLIHRNPIIPITHRSFSTDDQSPPSKESPRDRDVKTSKDRSQPIPVETSIRYVASEAFKKAYGDKLVWEQYRRNHKGFLPPRKTRRTCIRQGVISTGSPCPICRDEYLVLDHRNIDLIKQFISPYTGETYSYTKTGLCQTKHHQLLIAVERARDYGLITFDVPIRNYDYSLYYDKDNNSIKFS